MSSSVTTVGGVVVITQVLPRGESSIPLGVPAPSTSDTLQAPSPGGTLPSSPAASPTHCVKVDDMTSAFLRGQPHGLGVVQISLGLLCILFSLTAILSQRLLVNAPFCLAVLFVVSGSVALAAGNRTTVRRVWLSLMSNMVSVVVSVGGVAYSCWILADWKLSFIICEDSDVKAWYTCGNRLRVLDGLFFGVVSLVLILLVLQICVSTAVCVFSGKSIRRQREQQTWDQNSDTRGLTPNEISELDSDDAMIDPDLHRTNCQTGSSTVT